MFLKSNKNSAATCTSVAIGFDFEKVTAVFAGFSLPNQTTEARDTSLCKWAIVIFNESPVCYKWQLIFLLIFVLCFLLSSLSPFSKVKEQKGSHLLWIWASFVSTDNGRIKKHNCTLATLGSHTLEWYVLIPSSPLVGNETKTNNLTLKKCLLIWTFQKINVIRG